MRKRIWVLFGFVIVLGAIAAHYILEPWGFYWKVSEKEAVLRKRYVAQAETWLGHNEADGSHQQIIDIYNRQDVLPQGYALQSGDSWCAAFVSAAALEAELEIPMECSCQRQISLWQEAGRWVEDDTAIPLPGDLIYYNWDQKRPGENSGWSDHVGIVVGTKWPFVKTIEGNYDDQVKYRILPLWDIRIRGYGRPDFSK